ncbi:hypothetical protein HaLaN_23509, partial [Haematococcus lacustris]
MAKKKRKCLVPPKASND